MQQQLVQAEMDKTSARSELEDAKSFAKLQQSTHEATLVCPTLVPRCPCVATDSHALVVVGGRGHSVFWREQDKSAPSFERASRIVMPPRKPAVVCCPPSLACLVVNQVSLCVLQLPYAACCLTPSRRSSLTDSKDAMSPSKAAAGSHTASGSAKSNDSGLQIDPRDLMMAYKTVVAQMEARDHEHSQELAVVQRALHDRCDKVAQLAQELDEANDRLKMVGSSGATKANVRPHSTASGARHTHTYTRLCTRL